MSDTTIPKGSKVLVTGASGFLAIHCVQVLLDEGYTVVGTVRSASKGKYLDDLFKSDKFSWVIVEDISKADSFDEAVKGVDAIMHTASPFHLKADDPEELIRPAVDGTVGILKSAHANNKSVKRVVITSSVASILEPADPPRTFTEEDWNNFSPKEVEEKGKEAAGGHKYRASKVLAEKAAWKFVEDNKPSFDLATVNPPMIFGSVLQQCDKPESLNTSCAAFWSVLAGEKTEEDMPGGGGNYVHVHDVALAHFRALTQPSAGGNRFLTSGGAYCNQQFAAWLRKHHPELKNVPQGKEGGIEEANDPKNVLISSGAKAERELGIKYKTVEQCCEDMYKSFEAKGWLKSLA